MPWTKVAPCDTPLFISLTSWLSDFHMNQRESTVGFLQQIALPHPESFSFSQSSGVWEFDFLMSSLMALLLLLVGTILRKPLLCSSPPSWLWLCYYGYKREEIAKTSLDWRTCNLVSMPSGWQRNYFCFLWSGFCEFLRGLPNGTCLYL